MGTVRKHELQAWLYELHTGILPFEAEDYDVDTYSERVDLEGIEKQTQLRACFDMTKVDDGRLTLEEYQVIRVKLDTHYSDEYTAHVGSSKVFNPFAIAQSPLTFDKDAYEAYSRGEIDLEEYTRQLGCEGATGVVPEATGKTRKGKGRPAKETDPLRSKGKFAANVAQLWYYNPDTGLMCQVAFTNDNAIADAFRQAAEIQTIWEAAGLKGAAAWVKFRKGNMRGNRNVCIASAKGMLANPQDVLRLHWQAKGGGIKSPVGEVMCRTKPKHINLMLVQNQAIRDVLGYDDSIGKIAIVSSLDIPTVEPDDPNEIVYSIKMLSGDMRTVQVKALADTKDKETGEVTLAGHRRQAYRILLDMVTRGADSTWSAKYTIFGKEEDDVPTIHVVSHSEAIMWEEGRGPEEDEELLELSRLYHGVPGDDDSPGLEISKEDYFAKRGARLMKLDPPDPVRGSTVMSSGRTNVNYNSDGTVNWQKAKNSGGPGTNYKSREHANLYGGSNWGASVEAMPAG